jgi:hypothetical protein
MCKFVSLEFSLKLWRWRHAKRTQERPLTSVTSGGTVENCTPRTAIRFSPAEVARRLGQGKLRPCSGGCFGLENPYFLAGAMFCRVNVAKEWP